MAANITIGSLTLAADGVTLTGTLAGGTGTGYAISSAAGLQPHSTDSPAEYIIPTATPGISGTTITITLPTPYLAGKTVQLSVTAANTITDSGGNTGQVATNTAVTNNSTQTGSTDSILNNYATNYNINGALTVTAGNGISQFNGMAGAHTIEMAINVTVANVHVDVLSYLNAAPSGTLVWQVDGGSDQSYQGDNVGYQWIRVATGLGVGKHIIRFNAPSNFYTRATRFCGPGTAAIVTVPCPQALFKDSVAGLTVPNQVSPVKRWGVQKYTGNFINNAHLSFSFVVSGNFQGADTLGYTGISGTAIAYAVDKASLPAPLDQLTLQSTPVPGGGLSNSFLMMPLIKGQLSAGSHTVEVVDEGQLGFQTIRLWNGSCLASAASIGNTTISVPDITNIADGDWLCLDHLDNEELVKVVSHSGSGPYTLTLAAALAKAHASGAAARNFTPANAPTMTNAPTPSFRGRALFMGDSITHAEAISTSGVFPAPGYQNYDVRASYAMMAFRAIGWDILDCATQGWTAAQVATDNAPNTQDPTPPCTTYCCLIGTNDFGAGATPIATFQSSIASIIANIKTAAPGGTQIIFVDIFSSTNVVTNSIGKTKADYNAAIQAAIDAAADPKYSFRLLDLATLGGLDVGGGTNLDIPDHTHPSITSGLLTGTGGQNKLANALFNFLAGFNRADFLFAAAA